MILIFALEYPGKMGCRDCITLRLRGISPLALLGRDDRVSRSSAAGRVRRSVPVFALSGESISNGRFVGSVNAKAGNSREARQEKGAIKPYDNPPKSKYHPIPKTAASANTWLIQHGHMDR